jgi:hypothetical protein
MRVSICVLNINIIIKLNLIDFNIHLIIIIMPYSHSNIDPYLIDSEAFNFS